MVSYYKLINFDYLKNVHLNSHVIEVGLITTDTKKYCSFFNCLTLPVVEIKLFVLFEILSYAAILRHITC